MLSTSTVPKGRIRALNSTSDIEKLSVDLLAALYGEIIYNWCEETAYAPIDDCAIYISEVIHPFELAVFRCKDEGELNTVLGACASRLDVIQRTWQGSAYEAYVQSGIVTYYEAYVFLVISDDPEPLIKIAQKVIKQ